MEKFTGYIIAVCFLCVIHEISAACDPATCAEQNGDCVDDVCWCKANYGGLNCQEECSTACETEEVCVGQDNCVACQDTCVTPFGSCQSQGTTEPYNTTCRCEADYTGTDCLSCATDAACSNQGTCENGMCNCNENYGGYHCQYMCDADSCVNGRCEMGVCMCNPGFGGDKCETECDSPCGENEACIGTECKSCSMCVAPYDTCVSQGTGDLVNTTVCGCGEGLAGMDCRNCTNKHGCNNNTCTEGVCQCESGLYGNYCQLSCEGNTCPKYKECAQLNDTMMGCQCIEGLSGDDCMTVTCGADNFPCVNNATCSENSCTCMKQFAGVICDMECSEECMEDQSCMIEEGSAVCKENAASGLAAHSHVMYTLALIGLMLIR